MEEVVSGVSDLDINENSRAKSESEDVDVEDDSLNEEESRMQELPVHRRFLSNDEMERKVEEEVSGADEELGRINERNLERGARRKRNIQEVRVFILLLYHLMFLHPC